MAQSWSSFPEHQMFSDALKLWFCRHQTFGTEGMTRKFAKEAEGIISTSSTTRQSPEPRWPRVGQIFPCGILDGVFEGERFVFCSKSVHSTTPQVSRDLGTTDKPCTFLPEHQMLSDPLKLWFCRHQTFGAEGMTRKFARGSLQRKPQESFQQALTTRQSLEQTWR